MEAAGAPTVTAPQHRYCRIPGWHITQPDACRALASSCRTPMFFSTTYRVTSDTPIHQSVALSLVGGGSKRTRGHGIATRAKTEPTQQEPYNMCRNTGCSPPTSTKPRQWVPMGVVPSCRPAWSKFGETGLIRSVALHYSQTPTCGCAHIQRQISSCSIACF